jgi:hypothetical protein
LICTINDGTGHSFEISLKSLLQFDLAGKQDFSVLALVAILCSEAERAGYMST